MLVLSRKKDEVICIADNIFVKVVEIQGNKVRLGVTAPPQIPVHREEVANKVKVVQAAGDVPTSPKAPSAAS